MIKPTPGRIVWFTPWSNDIEIDHHDKSQPLAAIVAYVWSDTMVNLSVIDQNGTHHARTSVKLLQDEDAAPAEGGFAQWMPFQKGQASNADTRTEVK